MQRRAYAYYYGKDRQLKGLVLFHCTRRYLAQEHARYSVLVGPFKSKKAALDNAAKDHTDVQIKTVIPHLLDAHKPKWITLDQRIYPSRGV